MRTKSITIFCSIAFIFQGLALLGSVLGILLAIGIIDLGVATSQSPVSKAASNLTVPAAFYGVVTNSLILLSLYGLWLMKRWGVYLFGAIVASSLFITYAIQPSWVVTNDGQWWVQLIIPVIYLSVVSFNWKSLNAA